MKRYGRAWALCLLTLSLTASIASSPCGAEWKLTPAGWTATEPGYWGTLADGRDTLAALQSYRQAGERWKVAYEAQHAEFVSVTETLTERLAALERQIAEERRAWRAEAARERWKNALSLVIVVGAAVLAAGR